MQSKLAVVVLAALASVVSSSPLASQASNQLVGPAPAPDAAADLVFFTVCIDANHSGRCESLSSQRGACYNLYNGFDNDRSCAGSAVDNIVDPGIDHLSDFGFNDRARSYRCN
ncbi:MAG: hypothetical protein LQ350_001943 [Teloschistes chrysophthalmus]|nr:MAG: hypothetical protein LQ350_001943 [Niorma chrysophthalma]